MQIENLRPPSEGASARKLGLRENNTSRGGCCLQLSSLATGGELFFHPTPPKYVDYISQRACGDFVPVLAQRRRSATVTPRTTARLAVFVNARVNARRRLVIIVFLISHLPLDAPAWGVIHAAEN